MGADVAAGFVSAPDELKNKTVCEDQELKLHCHESKFLNIYSATYGRRAWDGDLCASEAPRLPPFGRCLHAAVVGAAAPWGGFLGVACTGSEGESRARRNQPHGGPPAGPHPYIHPPSSRSTLSSF